jgi:uncharacterized RDD family membrane protein YckC
MSQLYINTVQNVRIEQAPASVAERIVAQLIDYALFGGYALIFLLLIGKMVNSTAYYIVASLPMLFYDLFCEISMNGQSAGKKVMGIRVVKDDGSEPEISGYFLRWVFRIFDTVGTAGAVATLTTVINGKGKRLGDIVAGTRMIRLKNSIEGESLLPEISTDYIPTFREAVNLNDNDITIIREVLSFTNENVNSYHANQMLARTKSKIEIKLGIHSDWHAYNFLERIVKDYTFLSLNG